jgi:hypothetical protein
MFRKADWQPFLTPYIVALFVVLFFAKMLSPFLNPLEVSSTLCIVFSTITCIFAFFYSVQKKNFLKASILTSLFILIFSFKNPLIKAIKALYFSFFDVEKLQISLSNLYLVYALSLLIILTFIYFLQFGFSKILTQKFILFLNTSFLALSLIEFFNIISISVQYRKTYSPAVSQFLNTNANVSKLLLSTKDSLPDVYWFVLDEYTGFERCRESLNFDNQDFLKFFTDRKFFVATHAQSGYRETEKCIASIMNIKPLPPIFKEVNKEWLKASISSLYLRKMVKESFWGQVVSKHWELENNSFFDIVDTENSYNIDELTSMYSLKEYLWLEFSGIRSLNKFHNHNNLVLDKIVNEDTSSSKGRKAHFYYYHLLMPHFPYFYDENGKFYPNGNSVDTKGYVGYIKYTNKKIEKIVEGIQRRKPNAVIIVMGDHGNRNDFCKNCAFSPLFAIYLPHKENFVLPQNFNNINTFKVLLNEYFGQNLPYDKVSDTLDIQ